MKKKIKEYALYIYILLWLTIVFIIYKQASRVNEVHLISTAESDFQALKYPDQIKALIDFKNGKKISFVHALGLYNLEITTKGKYFEEPKEPWMLNHREEQVIFIDDSAYFQNRSEPSFSVLSGLRLVREHGWRREFYLAKDRSGKLVLISFDDAGNNIISYSPILKGVYQRPTEYQVVMVENNILYIKKKTGPKNLIYGYPLSRTFASSIDTSFTVQLPGNFVSMKKLKHGAILIAESNNKYIGYFKQQALAPKGEFRQISAQIPKCEYYEAQDFGSNLLLIGINFNQDREILQKTLIWVSKPGLDDVSKEVKLQEHTSSFYEYSAALFFDRKKSSFYWFRDDTVVMVKENATQNLITKTTTLNSQTPENLRLLAIQNNCIVAKSSNRILYGELNFDNQIQLKELDNFDSLNIFQVASNITFPVPAKSISFVLTIDPKLPSYYIELENRKKIIQSSPLKLDRQMTTVSRVPNVFIIVIVVFFFLAIVILGYKMLYDYVFGRSINHDHLKSIDSLPSLKFKILDIQQTMIDLRTRYNTMLFLGMIFGVGGVVCFFIIIQYEFAENQTWTAASAKDIIDILRAVVLLIFVETLTFFFLKQYRVIFNEYKLFYSIYIRLLNYVHIITISESRLLNDDTTLREKLIDKLFLDDFKMYTDDPKTAIDGEFLQAMSKNVFDKLIDKIPTPSK